MKILLIFAIIACSTYIGYGFALYYRQRLKFFKDLQNFSEKLMLEINFSKKNLNQIVESNFLNFGSEFKKVLNNFLSYLKDVNFEISNENIFGKNNYLTNDDKQLILTFLKSLGKYDLLNQIKEIENYNANFKLLTENAEKENKKFGGLYVKLGLLGGILIGILLI